MTKTIALIGANGQLATDIRKVAGDFSSFTLIPLSHRDIEIVNPDSIEKTLAKIKPTIIINTAAYNKVDDAEKEIETAFAINAFGCKYLAVYAKENDVILLHISTDYVFGLNSERKTPYRETDLPGPLNTYGLSKLTGEYFVRQIVPKYYIVRSSGLYGTAGSSGKGYNFVDLMLRLAAEKGKVAVVNDQFVTPTYTLDLAKQIFKLLETNKFGLYHATAQGSCSWYEFAKKIFELTSTKVKLIPIPTQDFPMPARRPAYSVLRNANLKAIGIDHMRSWKDGLVDYLTEKEYI